MPFFSQPVLKTSTGPHPFFNHQQTSEGSLLEVGERMRSSGCFQYWLAKERHSHLNDVSKFQGLFSTITPENQTYCFTINDLLRNFNKKTRFGKCYLKHFLLIYYNHQCREIKLCKNYWITDLVFQEHTSQIQTFSAP